MADCVYFHRPKESVCSGRHIPVPLRIYTEATLTFGVYGTVRAYRATLG